MKNKEKGVKKAVIVKFKGKHTHNSTEYLKTELKHENRRNGSKESRNLKSAKDVTPNLQSYSQIYSEGKGRTSRLNNILDNNINDDYDSRKDLNYHKEETKDLKEKEPSLKTQKNKKERLVKSQKKTVNFNQKIIKGQKSERNLEKEKKESEASLNARNKKIPEKDNNYLINRSMRSFNKKHILKNSGIDVSDSMEQSINIENGRIDDSKNYDKKNESKPIIKISKKDFDFKPSPEEPFSKKSTQKEKIKEAPKIKSKEEKKIINPTQLEQNEVNYNYEEKINPKDELIQKKEPDLNEDENHIPIIEIKNNFAQIKKNEFKNNNKEKDETKNEDMSNIYNNNDNTEQNNFNNENKNNKNNNIDINNKEIEKDLTNNIDINKKVSFKPNINHLEINNNFSPEINKKITYKTNLTTFSQEKPKKKEQKAYSNFIQNIKRANKKKKGNNLTNLLRYTEPKQKREDPKAKLSRAIRKLSLLNRTIIHTYKDINRSIDYRKGLESIARNINRKNANLRFYEFGNVYSFNPEADNSQVALAPYSEHTALGLWLTGHNHAGNWAEKVRPLSVYDLKAAVENIFKRLGINERELLVEQTDNDVVTPALLYKNRGGKLLGMLGVVEEKLLKRFDIDQEVYFAQLNWNAICKMAAKNSVKYYDLPKTLPVKRDLALLVDTAVTYDDIRRVVEQSEKKLLKSMTLFDVYEGKNLPAGKKSYAISLILQDDAKTMQDKQIDAIMQKIIRNLETQVGAQLR